MTRYIYQLCPKRIRRLLLPVLTRMAVLSFRPIQWLRHRKTLSRIRHAESPVRAVFLMLSPSVWKYDALYRLLANDSRFQPLVFVCPWTVANDGKAIGNGPPNGDVQAAMDAAVDFCRAQGYAVRKAWEGRWIDLDREWHPDLAFFSYAYDMTRTAYLQKGLKNSLSCYVTYGFNTDGQEQRQFNLPFFNLMWRGFYETPMHVELARRFADNGGKNVRLGGSLLFDEMRRHLREGLRSCWKSEEKKRIIWAPHHTVDDLPNESHWCCFLQMAEPMLRLAQTLEDRAEFVFKPHPKLFPKLCKLPGWGEKRAREYYAAWNALPNGQVQQGEYIDLFLTSDAMILDCLSFMCEYMFTGKPQLFMLRDETSKPRFNAFGEAVFRHLYHGCGMASVERFLEDTVFSGNDWMKDGRMDFFRTAVDTVPGGASHNVFDTIKADLGMESGA